MKESKYSSLLNPCVFILQIKAGLWQELVVEGMIQESLAV